MTHMNNNEKGFLENWFKIRERNSSVKTEIIAGLTSFVAMSYVIFVNPNILAEAGVPKEAAIAATLSATILATLLMGLWANFPVGVAPGMGLNAFFTYTVVLGMGLSWQTALGAVFISGVVFFLLTLGGIRQAIISAVPLNLKSAIVAGLCCLTPFFGPTTSGVVGGNPSTLVAAGNIAGFDFQMGQPAPMLTFIGVVITGTLMARRVNCALLIGIAITTLLGMLVGACPYPKGITDIISTKLPDISASFMAMDIAGALKYGLISIIFTFTVVELFDNIGTLIGLTRKAGLMKDDGSIENLDRALVSDAIGTMASAVLGTCTVSSYAENAAGVATGGRTGLTAVVIAALFALALLFTPLVGLVPAFATAPALIIVGCLMMSEVVHVDFTDMTEALPAFLTIIMMPLTYSIANGFAFGFISYALLKLFTGKWRDISWMMWIISLVFMVNFALRLG